MAILKNKLWPSLLVCCLIFGCSKAKDAEDAGKKSEDGGVPEVTLAKVVRAGLADELAVSGNLAALPNRDAKVSSLVAGRIAKIMMNEGDEVAADSAMAMIESGPLYDAVRQAEAAVAQAHANFENAKLSADRNEDLLKRGIAARKDVEDARTQLRVSEAAVKQSEAALSTAHTQLARAVLHAPFNGVVVHRFLGAGEQVDGSGTQPVFEIADISALELLGNVPASRLAGIRIGESFPFLLSAFPDSKFSARVVAILPAVDPATNNGTVRIRIDNPQHRLKLGMFITLALPVKSGGKQLVVPRQAIYPDESGAPHVYKVKGDQAESVAVKLGLQTKVQVEITGEIAEGDSVIITGGYGLPEKAKVKVVQANAEKSAEKKETADKDAEAEKKDTKEKKSAPGKKKD